MESGLSIAECESFVVYFGGDESILLFGPDHSWPCSFWSVYMINVRLALRQSL